jgi:hypothetical protein
VPARPNSDAVWVDGEWNWDGRRYRWTKGGWVVPAAGAKIAPWAVARRDDGQLFFSPSVWYGESGAPIPPPQVLAAGYVREPDAGSARATPTDASAVVDATATIDAGIEEPRPPENGQ